MTKRPLLILFMLLLCAALVSAARRDNGTKKRVSRLASAPASAETRANPYEGKPEAVKAGRKLYERYCAECHGKALEGKGKVPALATQQVEQSPPGDLFWFLTNGNLRKGMPAWAGLPEQQRWQIVTYLKSLQKPAQ